MILPVGVCANLKSLRDNLSAVEVIVINNETVRIQGVNTSDDDDDKKSLGQKKGAEISFILSRPRTAFDFRGR